MTTVIPVTTHLKNASSQPILDGQAQIALYWTKLWRNLQICGLESEAFASLGHTNFR
jgi:hypothetical protein